MVLRPYLGRPPAPRVQSEAPLPRDLDPTDTLLDALVGTKTPVSLGTLLGSWDQATVDKLLAKCRPQVAYTGTSELARVEATLLHLEHAHVAAGGNPEEPPPQNLFAPFTIPTPTPTNSTPLSSTPPEAALVHWAHVDPGSQVSVVYEGAAQAFPEVAKYWQPFVH